MCHTRTRTERLTPVINNWETIRQLTQSYSHSWSNFKVLENTRHGWLILPGKRSPGESSRATLVAAAGLADSAMASRVYQAVYQAHLYGQISLPLLTLLPSSHLPPPSLTLPTVGVLALKRHRKTPRRGGRQQPHHWLKKFKKYKGGKKRGGAIPKDA
jgi:hypothetical protein